MSSTGRAVKLPLTPLSPPVDPFFLRSGRGEHYQWDSGTVGQKHNSKHDTSVARMGVDFFHPCLPLLVYHQVDLENLLGIAKRMTKGTVMVGAMGYTAQQYRNGTLQKMATERRILFACVTSSRPLL
eukprot:1184908-Prorocentrum_minimum.AAC.2